MVQPNKKQQKEVNSVSMLVGRLFTISDMAQDIRFYVLACIQFFKMWFNLRVLKSIDNLSCFFFITYGDTFIQLIFDKLMSQSNMFKQGDDKVEKQLTHDFESGLEVAEDTPKDAKKKQ